MTSLFIHIMTMEVEQVGFEKVSVLTSVWLWVNRVFLSNILAKIDDIIKQTVNIAKDDPRKVTHSLKVGLTLTFVSLLYYVEPLYASFGVSAMWAVMTVVVVLEFSVGATLGKGLNRGIATLLAGALGLGAHHLASTMGKTYEPIMIELFVFLLAVVSTFIRFFPIVKARYDYGVLIFILTFTLVSLSGFRTDEIINLARERLSTILIGAITCVIVSVLVCPVWAGEDLHMLVAQTIETLGNFLEGIANECFTTLDMKDKVDKKPRVVSLSSVLDSKSREEILANFARWEPGHGKFMYSHPWKQYLKIGNLTRQCASRIEALNAYLSSQSRGHQEIDCKFQEVFLHLSSESGKVLKEVACTIRTMTTTSSTSPHLSSLKIASKNLNSLLKSDIWNEHNSLMQVIPIAAVSSLLFETVRSVEQIVDAVNELSTLAKFKSAELAEIVVPKRNKKKVNKVGTDEILHVCITIDEDGTTQVKKQGQSTITSEIRVLI